MHKIIKLYDALSYELTEFLQSCMGKTAKVVYHYEDHGYEGWGFFVAHIEGDGFYGADLGHCSCYGPLEHCEGPFETYDLLKERFAQYVGGDQNVFEQFEEIFGESLEL